MLGQNKRALLRLAAALILGPLLSGLVLSRGVGVLAEWRTLVFPYLWLYLFIEGRVTRRALSDGQVFLLGGAFSFVYDGLLTKRMQDSFAISGLDWVAVLGGPLEWGMTVVVWLHCLQALVPRDEEPAGLPGQKALVVGIPALVAVVYLWKSAFGHFRVEHSLGPMWLIDDLLLAGAAVWLWRRYRRSLDEPSYHHPAWVWVLAGLGLWFVGSGLLAEACLGLSAPKVLSYTVETFWLAALGIFSWVTWRDRHIYSDEPMRRSRPVLAAAAFRVFGTLLLLKIFGASDDPRMAFWSGLLCDWPSKVLFYYAFLTSRLEV
ncbi:MAG: hypothetical protein NTY77_17700 [Elusimicrobia bacterium]|nr:hypothetical protein [Elusimicrobiota bacterium]